MKRTWKTEEKNERKKWATLLEHSCFECMLVKADFFFSLWSHHSLYIRNVMYVNRLHLYLHLKVILNGESDSKGIAIHSFEVSMCVCGVEKLIFIQMAHRHLKSHSINFFFAWTPSFMKFSFSVIVNGIFKSVSKISVLAWNIPRWIYFLFAAIGNDANFKCFVVS